MRPRGLISATPRSGSHEITRAIANAKARRIALSGSPGRNQDGFLAYPFKVDIAALNIRADQLHPKPVADVRACGAAH